MTKDEPMRRLAETQCAELREYLDHAQAKWPEAAHAIALAIERLDAAGRFLTIKATDSRYADALAHAVKHLISAAMLYGMAAGNMFGEGAPKRARSELGMIAAKARHAADPKRVAKASALELWKERHAGKHRRLSTVKQFAMEVMHRWPVLSNPDTIRKWSAKWAKEVREGREPKL